MRHDGDYDDNVRAFRRVLDSTSPQRSADFEGLDVGGGANLDYVCARQ